MSERQHQTHSPDEKPVVPRTTSERHMTPRHGSGWTGPTYYGRSQLKPAPFNNWVVGGYIFLAGLSGSSSLLGAIAEAGGDRATGARSRYLGALAPTIGSALLVWDLHTPKRFYNMLRIAKRRSPMSIGTWILMGYSAAAMPAVAVQALADWRPQTRWALPAARIAQAPAAVAGMGLSVYTAALLSATSTPTWAAAPRALAVRFGASSVAAGSAALAAGAGPAAAPLRTITAAALVVETVAAIAEGRQIRRKGIAAARHSAWGRAERLVVLGLGTALPLGLLAWSRLAGPRGREAAIAADAASAAVLVGSAMLRVTVMEVGDISAERPDISFRFSQPANLPRDVARNVVPATDETAKAYPAG